MPRGSEGSRPSAAPLWVIGAGFVLILVAIVLGLQPWAAPRATPAPLPADPGGVPRVSLAEAKDAFDNGTAVFLDVRSAEEYEAGHVSGAVSIPLSELPERFGELDPDDWIITYCT